MEDNKNLEIHVSDMWTVLKRCWILMLAVLIVVGVGLYVFQTQTHVPKYSSTATFYVKRENANISYNEIYMANMLIEDFNELITNDQVYTKLYEKTGIANPKALKQMISTENPEDTRFTYVTFTADSPEEAQLLVNTFAEIVCNDFNALHELKKEDTVISQQLVGIYAYGTLNKNISNPVSILIISLIAAVCAILLYIVFLILHLMDDKINSADDVERYLQVSVLGEIPNRNGARKNAKYCYYAAAEKGGIESRK